MQVLFFLLIISLSLSGMENSTRQQQQKLTNKVELEIQFLENNPDACIIKHLIELDFNILSQKKTFENIRNFLRVNKGVWAMGADEKIIHFLSAHTFKIDKIWIATGLATPGARDFLKSANKHSAEKYINAIKFTVMNPLVTFYLKGLIACDDIGVTFKGIPRITPLMIAVGYNNEEAVDILIAEAKKRNILDSYINMQCPKDTCTTHEWFGTDNEYDFVCYQNFTALHIASSSMNRSCLNSMKKILEAGAHLNSEIIGTHSPLERSLTSSKEGFGEAALLMDYGADREQVLEDYKNNTHYKNFLRPDGIEFLKSYQAKCRVKIL